MIIGVDGYFLYEQKNTGMGTLAKNVFKEIARLDHTNTYILFTPKAFHKDYAQEIIQNKNIKIVEVDSIVKKWRRLWLQSLSLRKKIIQEKVDIFFGPSEYVPVLLPKNVKTIVTIHDVVFKIYPNTISFFDKVLYNSLLPLCVQKADAIITISHSSKEEIKRYLHVDESKISVIHNGIPVDKYKPPKKVIKKNYILFVGTLQPRKNLVNLLKAFVIIAKETDCSLIIIGAMGWKTTAIKDTVEDIDPMIRERIHFLGYINNDQLVDLYQKALIFAAPSLHEGFGLIILEALASGTPVVTSPCGAIPEIFKDSVVYADPLKPDDIAQKIVDLLKNKQTQKKMIAKGLAIAKQYDISKAAQKYIDFFNSFA